MTASQTPLSQLIYAAHEWWDAAGVSYDFEDDATAWFADESNAPQFENEAVSQAKRDLRRTSDPNADEVSSQSLAEPLNLLGDKPPQTLDAFHTFWLEAPGLDAIGPRGRVAPRGSTGAELMILVLEPEDSDQELLLQGPQGALLNNMIAAMGLLPEGLYFASALPRPMPMADTQAIADSGMGAVLAHHINLVKPRGILGFGTGLRPLLSLDVSSPETSLRESNSNSSTPPLLLSEALSSLLDMPRLKARFWRRWIEWSAHHL